MRPGGAIAFAVTSPGPVRVDIFDVPGRMVRTLRQGEVSRGLHELKWDGRSGSRYELAAALYFVRVKAAYGTTTHKIVFVE
jgi:hypothetical protein